MDEAKRLFSQATDARKVRATVLFLSVMVHSKVVFFVCECACGCFFVCFYFAIFAGPKFVEIYKFCYHGSLTYRKIILSFEEKLKNNLSPTIWQMNILCLIVWIIITFYPQFGQFKLVMTNWPGDLSQSGTTKNV